MAHFTLCSELLTFSASPIAFAPSSPMLLHLRLRGRAGSECQRLLTVRAGGSGALERSGRRILTDEARDNNGGEVGEALAREVNRINRLVAAQLLDPKRVAVEAADRAEGCVSGC